MPHSAHDVAALLIEEQNAAGRSIDKMQLQKLLGIVQGANLEFWGEPAFREPLVAFAHGPVVKAVEATYRDAATGSEPLKAPLGGKPARLSFEVVETVRTVLRYFGAWTGLQLEKFLKTPGSPWQTVRQGLAPSAASTIEIPLELIAEWFVQHGVNPRPPKAEVWDATEDERRAADERRRATNVHSVVEPFEITPELEAIARRALERVKASHEDRA